MSHLDSLKSLGNGTDLVELDEDRVSAAVSNTLGKSLGVGNKEVVAYELNLVAETLCELLPSFPVLFVESVLDGDDRVLLAESCPVIDKCIGGELKTGLGLLVEANALFALPLGRSSVHSDQSRPRRRRR